MNNIWVRGRGSRYRDSEPTITREVPNFYRDNDSDRGHSSYHRQDSGGYSSGYSNSNYYSGAMKNYHKNRSYKKSHRGQGGYKGQRGRGAGPRAALEEDDSMEAAPGPSQSSRRRFSPYGPGGKSNRRIEKNEDVMRRLGVPVSNRRGRGPGGYSRKTLSGGPSAWFKVHVLYGRNEEKDSLLKTLLNATSHPFVAKDFQIIDKDAVFYIQDSSAANALLDISGTLTNRKGFKILIKVYTSAPPTTSSLNPEQLVHLKVAMSERYDPSTKTLNLSNFKDDNLLVQNDIYVAFHKLVIVKSVLNIINEHIPELESLDLTRNLITNLSVFTKLSEKAPNLKRLNLGHNKISSDVELRNIQSLKLVELCMDGNPLCDKFKDEDSYVSAIRKRFPKILKLDGHELPPPITFDIDTSIQLPPSQGNYFGTNEQVKTLVCQFIQQYFQIYDSDDRSSLLEAYHDNASLSINTYDNSAINGWQASLSEYYKHNRNLKRDSTNLDKRQSLLMKGKLNVVQCINNLPKSEHILTSFVADVILLTPSMLTFSVQGMFKDNLSSDRPYTRSFNRVFITVPRGAGISILNEQLTITNATKKQITAAKQTAEQPTTSTAPSDSGAPSAPTQEQQAQLVQQFSVQSGMNTEWSAKCLQENNFNYDLAAKMFTELQGKGAIPPEAFVK